MGEIFILQTFVPCHDYIEPMAIFTAWAKIYSTKINISVCKGTCRWVGRTFCPTKISSCTAFLKHTFACQSAPHTLSYFFHTFIRHVGHRDVLNAVLGPCCSVWVVDLGRLSPTTLTLQDHSGGAKEKGWMIICYAEITDLILLTFGECVCVYVCVCVCLWKWLTVWFHVLSLVLLFATNDRKNITKMNGYIR